MEPEVGLPFNIEHDQVRPVFCPNIACLIRIVCMGTCIFSSFCFDISDLSLGEYNSCSFYLYVFLVHICTLCM